MARYTAIPGVPISGIEQWQSEVLTAMKYNIELLTGQRGESDRASIALTPSRITVKVPPAQTMTRLTARGRGVTISNTNLPLLDDYAQALNDIQRLANDVAALRSTVEVLILQLRGRS